MDTVDVPVTVLDESRHDEATDAELRLGEVIGIEDGTRDTEIDLSAVFDVRVGSPPKATAGTFAGTVLTIGYDGPEDRKVVYVDADESTLDSLAGLIYRRVLHEVEVAVSHPTKVGGRVTGKSFEIGTLLVAPELVGCRKINSPFAVRLESVVDFSRSVETFLDERRPAIDIQYVKQGLAVSLSLSLSSARKQHLLGRFLRRDYDDVRAQIGKIDLPTPAFRALVTLYSLRGTAQPQSIVSDSSVSTKAVLRGLLKANLVEMSDGEAALTSRGWILVTEHIGNETMENHTGHRPSSV